MEVPLALLNPRLVLSGAVDMQFVTAYDVKAKLFASLEEHKHMLHSLSQEFIKKTKKHVHRWLVVGGICLAVLGTFALLIALSGGIPLVLGVIAATVFFLVIPLLPALVSASRARVQGYLKTLLSAKENVLWSVSVLKDYGKIVIIMENRPGHHVIHVVVLSQELNAILPYMKKVVEFVKSCIANETRIFRTVASISWQSRWGMKGSSWCVSRFIVGLPVEKLDEIATRITGSRKNSRKDKLVIEFKGKHAHGTMEIKKIDENNSLLSISTQTGSRLNATHAFNLHVKIESRLLDGIIRSGGSYSPEIE